MNDMPGGGITRDYAGGKMLAAKDDGVGLITFNQPEKRNAMSLEMWTGLGEILDEFREDDSVRVVILSGAGNKAFVSGADISQFEKNRSDANAQQEYERLAGVGRAKYASFPKPLIARIRGFFREAADRAGRPGACAHDPVHRAAHRLGRSRAYRADQQDGRR